MPAAYESLVKAELPKVIEWRRFFHQNPELSNREFNTSKKIAEALETTGY
jgi:metal-dependent amidase/aminoacylase/carboxypeptidase family protein